MAETPPAGMHTSRSLNDADPRLAALVRLIKTRYESAFPQLYLVPVFTFRSKEAQRALWMQGRRPLPDVNGARSLVGLGSISEAENKRTVTNADGFTSPSAHNYYPSRAVDLMVTVDPDGPAGPIKAVASWDDIRYTALPYLANAHGLVSGGSWGDWGHLELARGG